MTTRVATYKPASQLENEDFLMMRIVNDGYDAGDAQEWWLVRDVVVGEMVVTFSATRNGVVREDLTLLKGELVHVKELPYNG